MAQGNELRVGNYIRIEAGGIVEVLPHHIEEICEGTLIGDDIQLTEDILLKCGFVRQSDSHVYYFKDLVRIDWFEPIPMVRYKAEVYDEDIDYYVEFNNVKIQYLHQLQNQVYFNTGEELKFTL